MLFILLHIHPATKFKYIKTVNWMTVNTFLHDTSYSYWILERAQCVVFILNKPVITWIFVIICICYQPTNLFPIQWLKIMKKIIQIMKRRWMYFIIFILYIELSSSVGLPHQFWNAYTMLHEIIHKNISDSWYCYQYNELMAFSSNECSEINIISKYRR